MATKHIPGTKPSGWLSKKWLVELVSSIPPVIVAGIAAYRLLQDPATERIGYFSVAAALWLVAAVAVKVIHAAGQDKDAAAKLDHDGLKAALWVLQAAVGQICGLDPSKPQDALRVTFHRVVPPLEDPQEIEQIVPYVGGGGGNGRRFSVRSGITGRCIRTKEPMVMHRQQGDVIAYRKDLALDWGFTPADAAKVAADRYSLMCVPVMDVSSEHALGVIYLDGKQQDLFVDKDVQTSIIEACAGVTRYVSERYL